jgi:hypothetical protein
MTTSASQHKVRQSRFGRFVLIAVLGLALGYTRSHAQEPLNRDSATLVPENGSMRLTIDSARPVARAVLTLETRYNYVITYEDPRYTSEDDLVDAGPTVRKNYSGSRPAEEQELLVPKAGKLTLLLPASSSISSGELAKVLHELIGLQTASTYGGHFRIEQNGDVFHVIPAEVRNHEGNWTPQGSLLDTRISLPVQDRSEKELYRAIAAAVSTAAHVSMGVVLNNGWVIGPVEPKRTISMGAVSEPARSVLMRALGLSSMRRTWALLHTTEDGSNVFSLNILDLPTPSEPLGTPADMSNPAPDGP